MSISRRLWLVTLATLLLLGSVLGAVLSAIRQSDSAGEARRAAFSLIMQMDAVVTDLRDAESAQRGYILSGRDSYLKPFPIAVRRLPGEVTGLRAQSTNDPVLLAQVDRLSEIVSLKTAELLEVIAVRRAKGFDAALAIVKTDRGEALMERASALVDQMGERMRARAEQRVLAMRRADSRLVAIVTFGGLLIAAVSVIINSWVILSIRRQYDALDRGVRRIAEGDLTTDIPAAGGGDFKRLATAFNGMMADLRAERIGREAAETALAGSNAALQTYADNLERKNQSVEVLSRLAARLAGCADEVEVVEAVRRFAPHLAPSSAGALYAQHGSEGPLEKVAEWSNPVAAPAQVDPRDGWTLGQDLSHQGAAAAQRCLPLIVQGQTVGLLYLEERDPSQSLPAADLGVLADTIGATLANLRLRQNLRDMSVRDALTGLFNRRHLADSLPEELVGAARANEPLSVVILDLDNFKSFNDSFGHEAGDTVLREVSQAITRNVRLGDTVFRYGGEEFMVVLPRAGAAQVVALAERVRAAVQELRLGYGGETMCVVSASLGVATFPNCGANAEALIRSADNALYKAKAEGKNRVALVEAMAA
ncbi:MAG TPA: diguanylate cyclase [Caulobacteraceae bacterium]|jgi:diguanylate cyclase (GGDEF)-like protein